MNLSWWFWRGRSGDRTCRLWHATRTGQTWRLGIPNMRRRGWSLAGGDRPAYSMPTCSVPSTWRVWAAHPIPTRLCSFQESQKFPSHHHKEGNGVCIHELETFVPVLGGLQVGREAEEVTKQSRRVAQSAHILSCDRVAMERPLFPLL